MLLVHWAGRIVYVEKPIAVKLINFNAFILLYNDLLFLSMLATIGPFLCYQISNIIYKKYLVATYISLLPLIVCKWSSYRVSHWYRNPLEGTRGLWQIGHWINLAVHLLSCDVLQDEWDIRISYSDISLDDNLTIVLTSNYGDLLIYSYLTL